MEYRTAVELLPKFSAMVNTHSQAYNEDIVRVFVGSEDGILTDKVYESIKWGRQFPGHELDRGRYTLCAAFASDRIASVKMIVSKDGLRDLQDEAEPLTYMRVLEHGITPEQDSFIDG